MRRRGGQRPERALKHSESSNTGFRMTREEALAAWLNLLNRVDRLERMVSRQKDRIGRLGRSHREALRRLTRDQRIDHNIMIHSRDTSKVICECEAA